MNRSKDKNEDKKMIQVNNVREESGEHVPKVSVIIPFQCAESPGRDDGFCRSADISGD